MLLTRDGATGLAGDAHRAFLVSPDVAEEVGGGHVIVAAPRRQVTERLRVVQQVEQTAEKDVVGALWARLNTRTVHIKIYIILIKCLLFYLLLFFFFYLLFLFFFYFFFKA